MDESIITPTFGIFHKKSCEETTAISVICRLQNNLSTFLAEIGDLESIETMLIFSNKVNPYDLYFRNFMEDERAPKRPRIDNNVDEESEPNKEEEFLQESSEKLKTMDLDPAIPKPETSGIPTLQQRPEVG